MDRAIIHILTRGQVGHSPHVAADVIRMLRGKGRDVSVQSICFSPLRMSLTIDKTHHVEVRPAPVDENSESEVWFYVCKNNSMVRVNACRSIAGPVTFCGHVSGREMATVCIHPTDWMAAWPTSETTTCEEYVSRVMGEPVATTVVGTLYYLSEVLLTDAIDLVLTHA